MSKTVEIAIDTEPLSTDEVADIKEGLADIKAGRKSPYEKAAKRIGLRQC